MAAVAPTGTNAYRHRSVLGHNQHANPVQHATVDATPSSDAESRHEVEATSMNATLVEATAA